MQDAWQIATNTTGGERPGYSQRVTKELLATAAPTSLRFPTWLNGLEALRDHCITTYIALLHCSYES